MAKAQDQNGGVSGVWLGAVAAFLFGFSSLGSGWNSFRARVHRASRVAGIRRALQRSRAPVAADLLLFAAPAPSVCAVELTAGCVVVCRLAEEGCEFSGNILAYCLEP